MYIYPAEFEIPDSSYQNIVNKAKSEVDKRILDICKKLTCDKYLFQIKYISHIIS